MPFSKTQSKALAAKLSASHVKTRVKDGMTLSYIEGWHAIAEANRIFGFDGWSRETVKTNCVWQGGNIGKSACSYTAQVRISVRAGDSIICREGCGSGNGSGATPGEAHEKALKEAETDAMKRALSTFGNPFGLALYDKEQKCVRNSRKKQNEQPITWIVYSEDGKKLHEHKDPTDFCSSLKQHLELINDPTVFMDFWKRNQETVGKLRELLPNLKTDHNRHYGEILSSIYSARLMEFAARKSNAEETVEGVVNDEGGGGHNDVKETADNTDPEPALTTPCSKSIPPYSKRIRDKGHLRFVASQSCLICGRTAQSRSPRQVRSTPSHEQEGQ